MKRIVLTILTIMLITPIANAQNMESLFNVPRVRSTGQGAEVFQPQTGVGYTGFVADNAVGDGYSKIPGNFERAGIDLRGGTGPVRNPGFGGTHMPSTNERFTPDPAYNPTPNFPLITYYRPPLYDPFESLETPQLPEQPRLTSPIADFTVKKQGFTTGDNLSGTPLNTFIFNAQPKSDHTPLQNLQVRWDFNSDGKYESYYSGNKMITFQFPKAGYYDVTLQVLDQAGNTTTSTKTIKIVNSTAPTPIFTVDKVKAPVNSVLAFNTSLSTDNQYPSNMLLYRFDWDGDGHYDTPYDDKTRWNHMFSEIGTQTVKMEASDPEGNTARAKILIEVLEDAPPKARVQVNRQKGTLFYFTAGESSDDFTERLKYRWDFDYQGETDLVWNTQWSGSALISYNYQTAGKKRVRVQVQDQQGFTDSAEIEVEVDWTDEKQSDIFKRISRIWD